MKFLQKFTPKCLFDDVSIAADNGLVPVWHQAIIWSSDDHY